MEHSYLSRHFSRLEGLARRTSSRRFTRRPETRREVVTDETTGQPVNAGVISNGSGTDSGAGGDASGRAVGDTPDALVVTLSARAHK
jgi:hypothetical protein